MQVRQQLKIFLFHSKMKKLTKKPKKKNPNQPTNQPEIIL